MSSLTSRLSHRTITAPRPSFRQALAELSAAQKTSAGAPAYSRFVNRPLGRVLAAAGAAAGATPNRVTSVSAILTFAGIALIATIRPGTATAIAVPALLVLGYALDSADGQLARLQQSRSVAGEWLDHMVDATKSSALHVAVAIAWFRFYGLPHGWLLVPLGFAVVAPVFFFGMILSDQLRRQSEAAGSAHGVKPRPLSRLYALAVLPADYGLMCLLFVATAWPPVFVVLYTVVFACQVMIVPASAVRWYRQMRRLG